MRCFKYALAFLVMSGLCSKVSAQENEPVKSNAETETAMEVADTSFTYEKYAEFLKRISDTSRFVVLPIDEFRKKHDTTRIVIGLRHDVDNDLEKARRFSETEHNSGFRSTYYILHTAGYYLADPNNKAVHNEAIIPVLRDMQNRSGFEIGWHNDLVTLQVVYNLDPVAFLKQELAWLRSNGLKITGSASHGSSYCKVYWYLNFYFFPECSYPVVGNYVNNNYVTVNSKQVAIKKGGMSEFGLEYEAYFLDNNKYFSDASYVNGSRWHTGMLDVNSLKQGDRVIILLHPIHWHRASTEAGIKYFYFEGQKSSLVNEHSSSVSVVMPYGTDRSSLAPSFTLSAGAYAKVSGAMQTSSVSVQNFENPVNYVIVAENRDVKRTWTVNVDVAKNSACSFESFSFPGDAKRIITDHQRKTITARLYSSANIRSLTPRFTLSAGATAWIENTQQFSGVGSADFTSPVTYRLIAEDGVTSGYWTVNAGIMDRRAEMISFSIPGLAKPASIDTAAREIVLEVKNGQPLDNIPAMFSISPNAKAWVNGKEQISGLTLNSFSSPVTYKVISEDSLTIRNWKIIANYSNLSDEASDITGPEMTLYPNPASTRLVIEVNNLKGEEARLDIFSSLGERVYSRSINNTASYSEEVDITAFAPGLYVARCSTVKKPVVFIIAR